MTVDHHGGTAGVATLLVRAMDEILGTHNADALLHQLDDGIAAASQLIEPETGPWHSPLAVGTLWVALMNACCGRKPRVTGSSVRNVSSAFSAGHPLDGSLSARDDRQISGS
jgi:hypothetical protein